MEELSVLAFDADAAFEYGHIRHALKSQGNIIGANDMLIAAHARSMNLILVTHNTREFRRIPDLQLEDWA